MHIPSITTLALFFTTTIDALPFRRGSKTRDEESEALLQMPQNRPFRNAVVDEFYREPTDGSNLTSTIRDHTQALQNFLVETRRHLHQTPELMYQEEQTSASVQALLDDWGVRYTTGWAVNRHPDRIVGQGGYGIVAEIGSGKKPCVLLRADMDALPIQEETDVQFKSPKDQHMHACGHDGHTTMLLGAARLLKMWEDSIPGTVRLVFQPAEEGGAGAKRMIEEGLLKQEPRPAHAMGMHVWPTLPSGTVASRPGPLLAAAERFMVKVQGVGGHAAMPHLTKDPMVASAAMIMNLQTIVSRNTSPLEAGVCSITQIEAGKAFNIIPDTVSFKGTVRALTTETLLKLRDKVAHIVESTATTYDCNVTITYSPDYYPPTVNDPNLFEHFSKQVGAIVSEESELRETEPTMGAEDFSFIAEGIPSTFYLLGQGDSSLVPPSTYGLHHPKFNFDESVLARGVELHVNWALRILRRLEEGNATSPQ